LGSSPSAFLEDKKAGSDVNAMSRAPGLFIEKIAVERFPNYIRDHPSWIFQFFRLNEPFR